MPEEAILVSAPSALSEENPWPGLVAFKEADQAYFHGRAAETAELLRYVKRELLTVLFGLSGLGKSSLLQAGLFPVLRNEENILPVYIRLDFENTARSLSDQILDAVAIQAADAQIEAPKRQETDTLWEYFHRRDADFWTRRNQLTIPLLVLDQFEEMFTRGQKDADRIRATQALIDELAGLVEGKAPPAAEARFRKNPSETENFLFARHAYKILIVLREDFLPEFEALNARMAGIMQNRMRLKNMNGEAALQAVNQAPRIIDEAVAEQVVRFVAAAKEGARLASLEVEPAILSLVCSELNGRRGQSKITRDLLQGNKDQVLQKFYEDSFVGLPSQVRVLVEDDLVNEAGFRDSIALVRALAKPGVTRASIDRLVERRLIRIEDLNGDRLELIHDRLTGVVLASKAKRTEAARRRKLMWASVILALALAVSIGIIWYVLHLQREAQKETRRAEAATKQSKINEEKAVKSDGEAQEAKTKAEDNQKLAEEKAGEAKKSADDARKSAVAAKASEAKAKQSAADKEAETIAARKAEKDADDAKAAAVTAEAQAVKDRETAEGLQKSETQRAKSASAQADLSQALLLVEKGRGADAVSYQQALAYLSRSLANDPDSMPAKALAMDLLIRGRVPMPAMTLLSGGNPSDFIDPVVFKHGSAVLSARFDPNGPLTATADFDKQAGIYDTDGAERHLLKGHTGLVNSVVFDRSGHWVVTASQDGTARIWSVDTGDPKPFILQHAGPVLYASFSFDGKWVVTASWDRTAKVWDAGTGAPFAEYDHAQPVTSASFDPNGRIVTSCWDNFAYVWIPPTRNLKTGQPLYPLPHRGQVNFAAFSEDGKRVVTASDDDTAQVWEGTQPIGEPMRHTGRVNSAMFSADGLRVVTASDDKTARVWDAGSGKPISIPLVHDGRVTSAAFDTDGSRVITASATGNSGQVRIWRVPFQADGTLLGQLAEAVSGFQIAGNSNFVRLPNQAGLLRQLSDQASPTHQADPSHPPRAVDPFIRWFFQRGDR